MPDKLTIAERHALIASGADFTINPDGSITLSGVTQIAEERQRQIDDEGWTEQHDDSHDGGEMTYAALCYVTNAVVQIEVGGDVMTRGAPPPGWPWAVKWWKPSSDGPIRDLVKAGALIAAEIDRLERLDIAKHAMVGILAASPMLLSGQSREVSAKRCFAIADDLISEGAHADKERAEMVPPRVVDIIKLAKALHLEHTSVCGQHLEWDDLLGRMRAAWMDVARLAMKLTERSDG